MGTLAPLFVVLVLPELWKNRANGALEVECTAYYSLRQVYAARLVLFGLADLALLTGFFSVALLTGRATWEGLILHFLLPFLVTGCICLRTLSCLTDGGGVRRPPPLPGVDGGVGVHPPQRPGLPADLPAGVAGDAGAGGGVLLLRHRKTANPLRNPLGGNHLMALILDGLTKTFQSFPAVNNLTCTFDTGVYGLLGSTAREKPPSCGCSAPSSPPRRGERHLGGAGHLHPGPGLPEPAGLPAPGVWVLPRLHRGGLPALHRLPQGACALPPPSGGRKPCCGRWACTRSA